MLSLILLLVSALTLTGADGSWVTTTFKESTETFQNPGKGWMTGKQPPAPQRFPASVTYFRLNWSDLEPEEGHINWALIDDQIKAWQPHGVRISFRIMTTNAHSRGYYSSPKWLFDAGCKSFEYLRGGDDPTSGGKRIPRIEPDYSAPLFLSKHRSFLVHLGKRYDGNAAIEFIDVGSYGIWGEWHTSHPAPLEVRRQIIDMYTAAFQGTPLMMMTDDADALAYALPRGVGIRRDGVGSPSHEKNWIGSKKYAGVTGFAEAWKTAPVVFEWYGDYKYLQEKQWSFDRAIQFMLDNHVTMINDNVGAVPPEEMPKLMELARRSGYRFVLRELSHPKQATRGKQLAIRTKWSNVGVGTLYRQYFLDLYLIDTNGEIVQRTRTTVDPRKWLPGNHEYAGAIEVDRKLKPSVYSVGLAFVDSAGKPAIRLAIDYPESNRVYKLGEVTVR
jgi:hypothetical protein